MGGPDANTDRLKQSISAVRASGGFPGNETSVTETGGQEKESDSQAQSCLLQQKPRGHVGCSRSGMSRIY